VRGQTIWILASRSIKENAMKRFNRIAAALLSLGVLVAPVASFAGSPRPSIQSDRVLAHSTQSYSCTFYAGQLAAIVLVGDGSTTVDVYVYDSAGNLVQFTRGNGDRCRIRFTPEQTQTFTIHVINRGDVSDDYSLGTN
jgi:hypothetical protein